MKQIHKYKNQILVTSFSFLLPNAAYFFFFFLFNFKWDTEQVLSHANDFNTRQDIKVEHEGVRVVFSTESTSHRRCHWKEETSFEQALDSGAWKTPLYEARPSLSAPAICEWEGKYDNGKFYEKASRCNLGVIDSFTDNFPLVKPILYTAVGIYPSNL